jgi:hypothetical protein
MYDVLSSGLTHLTDSLASVRDPDYSYDSMVFQVAREHIEEGKDKVKS